ncbi:hypothetical protein RKE29_22765 [Streptomyces sp. B1866]|uniref:hypothetical protein n=1 Tax=Streptomyces sp. B1866 TaxID=3075431 RepID=UPI002890CF4B|nr:hypothetical protein [Streptomyces sp. B1866]MDT3399433.1 hypothetical protein [Streptomyces sp. B1866]
MLAWPVVYICRLAVIYLLGSKALDKANPAQVPAIMDAVTERRTGRRGRTGPAGPGGPGRAAS